MPLAIVMLVSWGIAFVEYCFAVPANRIGNAVYSPAELKSLQEVITLIVFAGFTAVYFKEPLTLDPRCWVFADRSRRGARLSRPVLRGAGSADMAPDGLRPSGDRDSELHAPQDVADRQDDIGDDGDPKGVGADNRDCDKGAEYGQHGQNQRNDENRGGRR